MAELEVEALILWDSDGPLASVSRTVSLTAGELAERMPAKAAEDLIEWDPESSTEQRSSRSPGRSAGDRNITLYGFFGRGIGHEPDPKR